VSTIIFQDQAKLGLLWLIPVLGAVLAYAAVSRRRALSRLIEAGLQHRNRIQISPLRRGGKAALVLFAVSLMAAGMARPGWKLKPQTVESHGRDLIFVLDVSRSMLAEDLAPNRLGRAKLAIRDCLERLNGDRVALVVFAGAAVMKCPLTTDYDFLRFVLEGVSTDTVPRGGTMIGDGIRVASRDVVKDELKSYQDLILITDGGDQGSFPVEAAKAVGERGVRLLAVGLGNETEGERIRLPDRPSGRSVVVMGEGGIAGLAEVPDEPPGMNPPPLPIYLEHAGQEVRTRLEPEVLREMVNATPGGKYFHVGTGTIDLGAVYRDVITSATSRALQSPADDNYEEEFQIFLALALAALALEMILSERRRADPRAAL
jgi:Ca-activated chloride channel homolog